MTGTRRHRVVHRRRRRGGDPAPLAAQLAGLEAGTPLAARIDDVLAGRLGMRELAEDPDLVEFAHRGMAAFDELWGQMSPAERADALAAGEAFEADVARRA